jgi:hypothetical protein
MKTGTSSLMDAQYYEQSRGINLDSFQSEAPQKEKYMIKVTEEIDKPLLEEATFNFSQEANCMSENDGAEFLEIKCLSDLGIDRAEKCFYVIKTEGWSIDNLDELQELFDRIQKTLYPKKK